MDGWQGMRLRTPPSIYGRKSNMRCTRCGTFMDYFPGFKSYWVCPHCYLVNEEEPNDDGDLDEVRDVSPPEGI